MSQIMSPATKYDAIIIGSGQAGGPLAGAFAKAGKKTALVEREHIGGTCINEGCTPTKTMIASGRVAHLTVRGPDYGIHINDISEGPPSLAVDMKKIRQRKRDIVDRFRSGSERRLKDAGVECYMGEASFVDSKSVKVKMNDGTGDKIISSDLIFINTGERPALPALDGTESIPVLNSTSIMELDVVPSHLIVLGGGYIGIEFGQLFRRLGAKVTIVQRGFEILEQDGITVLLQTTATKVTRGRSDIDFELSVKGPSGTQSLQGSHLLAAAGRKPNSDMLNLAAAGVHSDSRGYIISSPTLETNVNGIYALGDVKGPPAFTHISYDDYRIVLANILEKRSNKLTTTNRIVPYTVFMDPQLGHVGLHENEATAQGLSIKVAVMPMTSVARALEVDETRGFMKAVVDKSTDKIIGFTILGLEGGEVMSMVQMAMMGGLTWQTMRDAVFSHPTLAESLNNLWGSLKDVDQNSKKD